MYVSRSELDSQSSQFISKKLKGKREKRGERFRNVIKEEEVEEHKENWFKTDLFFLHTAIYASTPISRELNITANWRL